MIFDIPSPTRLLGLDGGRNDDLTVVVEADEIAIEQPAFPKLYDEVCQS
jgi:hypothetical protein